MYVCVCVFVFSGVFIIIYGDYGIDQKVLSLTD